MNKQVTPKIVLIIVLVLLAALTLYPPSQTLKPGIDLAGGVSLIFEINTFGLQPQEKSGLSQRMITVLRRRIDPANIQNLIWRPQGNNRFEIQMPLASAEAIEKREIYETTKEKLLDQNVSRARIIRALSKPLDQRQELFMQYAQGDPNRVKMLDELAGIFDKRMDLQSKRDTSYQERQDTEQAITDAGMNIDSIKILVNDWKKLDEEKLAEALSTFTDVNDNIPILNKYVTAYSQWASAVDELTELHPQYVEAINALDNLNLTEDQLNVCLELPEKTTERTQKINKLKESFKDRAELIEDVVKAYDAYRPFRGRLDDPKDLQRMLKGAGILSFRILPTLNPDYGLDADLMNLYVERLEEKGPKYASDSEYIWFEIENYEEWHSSDKAGYATIDAQFGSKHYILTSNKKDEIILHGSGQEAWKLEKSFPTNDNNGRRAIGLLFDIRGGKLFSNVTNKNKSRPLCILLDDLAISAPSIDSRVGRNGIITGSFTEIQVDDMVNKLNAGSLPARLIEQPISVNTIGPSIGADNRDQGITAGIIGLIIVIACMAIYYCKAGSIADVALLMNMLFVLAIMAGIRATFTLDGIAGLILTIGMSVDANVLIFERIREEQEKGSSLRIAITNGYQKAFRTIFDANLTTFITAAILYWRASEEVKGFAIVLMLGILSSMFTALFVTRVIFDFLLNKKLIKDHLMMLRLIHNPNVNWMKSRTVFFVISSVLIVSGLLVFFSRNDIENSKYDIEFTGGTSAQFVFAPDINITQQEVQSMLREKLPAANVYSVGEPNEGRFEITTTETNKITVAVTFNSSGGQTAEQVERAINSEQKKLDGNLSNLLVSPGDNGQFAVSTSQMNQSMVKEILSAAFPEAKISEPQVDEVVNNAILETFAGKLEIRQNLEPTIVSEEKITPELIDVHPELTDFLGGIKIEVEIDRTAALEDIKQRISDLQFKPDTSNLEVYDYEILHSDLSEDEWAQFSQNEKKKITSAASLEASLPRVRQFDPSVGAEQKRRTLIAIFLSLCSIVTYVWIRFGNVRYGIAAIVALVHDVCITLGAVAACTYIAGTTLGNILLVGDFKINLAIIAAFLTLIGYSLNDTIVVFDRIRENRGKARQLNPQVITDSINQTISRTILTSFTTFIVVLIMYIFGGPGLRGFSFAIGLGIIVGTYSSIAIAAPILLIGAKTITEKK